VFTGAYAVIPKGVMYDIVTSYLPFWEGTRLWVLSRPLSGFAETFSQYIMEVASEGGSDRPEPDQRAEGVLDWVEVEAGDYMWLRAFCPQACYAGGPGRFRYLLYKDVNRHAKLRP
jgi:(S)-ureidoglycine aminohydrolase